MAHRDKGIHNANADVNGNWTPQDRRKHGHALFRKGKHADRGMSHALEPVTVCDQFRHLASRELKAEARRKSFGIALDRLIQDFRLNVIEERQVSIKHDLLTANCQDQALNDCLRTHGDIKTFHFILSCGFSRASDAALSSSKQQPA